MDLLAYNVAFCVLFAVSAPQIKSECDNTKGVHTRVFILVQVIPAFSACRR